MYSYFQKKYANITSVINEFEIFFVTLQRLLKLDTYYGVYSQANCRHD
jgi:hypothetical protein